MKDSCPDDSEIYDSEPDSEKEYVPDSDLASEDSEESLDLQERKCFLHDLLDDCSKEFSTICDSAKPDSDINYIASVITVEEEPCSSQDPSGSIVVGAFQKKW